MPQMCCAKLCQRYAPFRSRVLYSMAHGALPCGRCSKQARAADSDVDSDCFAYDWSASNSACGGSLGALVT
jgi:hypothetical protein